jgi:SP family sugar:H+ symporter-like MFS transporter
MMIAVFNDVLVSPSCYALRIGLTLKWAFVVSFTAPYIMNHIGGKIGFIFGGVAMISLVFAILILPELAGRSLEEVDELFEVSKYIKRDLTMQQPRFRWGWQFKGAKTVGLGAQIAELEGGVEVGRLERVDSGKGSSSHVENAPGGKT